MIVYTKLWTVLKNKGYKKTDLNKIISAPTISKLSKNESVSISIIGKICDFLECQPGDIMENVNEKQIKEIDEKLKQISEMTLNALEANGLDKEIFIKSMKDAFPKMIENLFNQRPIDGEKIAEEFKNNLINKDENEPKE